MESINTGSIPQRSCSDFVVVEAEDFGPTQAVPGSLAKLSVLCQRAEMGLPLWHHDDCVDQPGLSTSMRRARKRLTTNGDP